MLALGAEALLCSEYCPPDKAYVLCGHIRCAWRRHHLTRVDLFGVEPVE